jgi:hemerythrin-like domain-containing protein
LRRHASLVPLSREHHDGLLLATRLQQGRAALPRLWSHDLAWQAQYVTKFFDEHLAAHFATEEEYLFPPGALLPGMAPVVEELRAEHDELRSLAHALRTAPGQDLECTLTRFGQILEHHIRTEERAFFPACEEHLPAAELERIARAVAVSHGTPP